MTKNQAIAFANQKLWEPLSYLQRVRLQMAENLLCMPFSVFHEAMEKVLDRPVWTHEFAQPELLRDELDGKLAKPTMEEIIGKLPKN